MEILTDSKKDESMERQTEGNVDRPQDKCTDGKQIDISKTHRNTDKEIDR
jgi:hypothetical protein